MKNTYTYTARNVEDPTQVITFTLHGRQLTVDAGPPMEQIETVIEQLRPANEETGEEEAEPRRKLWLRPVAVTLLQRGVGSFRIQDVGASIEEDRLKLSAWFRAGGLALLPVTLMDGRVDNPRAAEAFVEELETRKAEASGFLAVFRVMDYWITWLLAGLVFLNIFQRWRQRVFE